MELAPSPDQEVPLAERNTDIHKFGAPPLGIDPRRGMTVCRSPAVPWVSVRLLCGRVRHPHRHWSEHRLLGAVHHALPSGDGVLLSPAAHVLQAPEVSFGMWLVFGIPLSFGVLAVTFFMVRFHGRIRGWCKLGGRLDVTTMLPAAVMTVQVPTISAREVEGLLKELGPVRWDEASVLVFFCILVFLWIFRQPEVAPGSSTGERGWCRCFQGGDPCMTRTKCQIARPS